MLRYALWLFRAKHNWFKVGLRRGHWHWDRRLRTRHRLAGASPSCHGFRRCCRGLAARTSALSQIRRSPSRIRSTTATPSWPASHSLPRQTCQFSSTFSRTMTPSRINCPYNWPSRTTRQSTSPEFGSRYSTLGLWLMPSPTSIPPTHWALSSTQAPLPTSGYATKISTSESRNLLIIRLDHLVALLYGKRA